jgi:glycogen debranching enzyme
MPNRYWRGSTWININWFIIKGLKDYGFNDIADELKKKTIKLVEEKGFHEFFNPFTGRGVGVNDFAWSGLIIDL